jgi:2-iminoacetate synthase
LFSNVYQTLDSDVRKALGTALFPSPRRVDQILQRSENRQLDLVEIAELLKAGDYPENLHIIDSLRGFLYSKYRKPSQNTLRYIAPVYLSSFCVDKCGYCQFSANRHRTVRYRLTLQELENELRKGILPDGIRVVEFTLATDPYFTPDLLSEYIAFAKSVLNSNQDSGVLICSDYFSSEEYIRLKEAGLWGMVQWDETLDKACYDRWHRGSPRKSDMTSRIDSHDRALAAGLNVATGFLFGLADYKYDVMMQIAKARYLGETYGKKPCFFGTARVKPVGGRELQTEFRFYDFQYEVALMVYKIAEPFISRWLQTRETPELNLRHVLDGDIYTYKCGEVKPGGYFTNTATLKAKNSGQFAVHEQTRQTFESEIARLGFSVDYAWIRS